jgi:N-acetylmuramoyl-L-alanine amidase
MSTAEMTSVFPSKAEYVSAGDTITFRATAPVSATVSVRLNGTTLELRDDNRERNSSLNLNNGVIYQTTYSATYTVPENSGTRPITDLGNPTYTMTYGGTEQIKHGAPVNLIGKNAPFYATVKSESAWVFPGPTTTGGTGWNLLEGQKDAVTAISRDGSWARLSTGMWIETEHIATELKTDRAVHVLSDGTYTQGENIDVMKWKATDYPAVNVTYDGENLKIYFPLHDLPPSMEGITSENIYDTTVFSVMEIAFGNGIPYYSFKVKDNKQIEGYYISFADGEFSLNIKKPRKLTQGDKPLAGFTFVIDAGHGGNDSGAVGMLGGSFAEKHVNLVNSIKLGDRLTALGATVIQTRTTDVFHTLQERTEINRRANPDMFISMHGNAVAETTNATNIRGITFWYRNTNAKPLADHLMNELYDVNPLTTRNRASNHANFYVMRPTWSPSVLVESSFMCNIQDFAWLINPARQDELADKTAMAILSYYGY